MHNTLVIIILTPAGYTSSNVGPLRLSSRLQAEVIRRVKDASWTVGLDGEKYGSRLRLITDKNK